MSEMTATRMRLATLAGVVFWLGAAWLLWRTQVPDLHLDTAALLPTDDEAENYAAAQRRLWALRVALQLAVAVALVWSAPRLAARLPGSTLVRSLLMLLATLVALWLVAVPVRLLSHRLRREYDLSEQGYLAFLVSPWAERLGSLAAAVAGLAAAVALARRFGDRWWIPGGAALAALGTAVVLLQPLVLAPRLEPLREERLENEIGALAAAQGLDPPPVEVRRMRDRTRAGNAEVAGIGPTRRVVLWDTILEPPFGRDEVVHISAHELAHVSRHHIWKGLAWFCLLALPIAFVLARAARRFGGPQEPVAVPALVLAAMLIQLALAPAVNELSRRYEAEADWVALETARDPEAALALFRHFVERNRTDPDPPTWSYLLLSTHPSLEERAAMVQAWRARVSSRAAAESRGGS
jgi:Zn-dependent protease with chaperone function